MKSFLPPALGLTRSFIYICSGSGQSPVILCKSESVTCCLSSSPPQKTKPKQKNKLLHGSHCLGPLLPPPSALSWGHLGGDGEKQRAETLLSTPDDPQPSASGRAGHCGQDPALWLQLAPDPLRSDGWLSQALRNAEEGAAMIQESPWGPVGHLQAPPP